MRIAVSQYRYVASKHIVGRRSTHDWFWRPEVDDGMFDERYDTDNLQAALADAGFDSQDNREFCQEQLDCPLLTAINPRRSSSLKSLSGGSLLWS